MDLFQTARELPHSHPLPASFKKRGSFPGELLPSVVLHQPFYSSTAPFLFLESKALQRKCK